MCFTELVFFFFFALQVTHTGGRSIYKSPLKRAQFWNNDLWFVLNLYTQLVISCKSAGAQATISRCRSVQESGAAGRQAVPSERV